MRFLIFFILLAGFYLLFREMQLLNKMGAVWEKTRTGMEATSRQRLLSGRKELLELQTKSSFWWSLDKKLRYSGLQRRFPGLTAEWWLLGNLLVQGCLFLAALALSGGLGAVCVCLFSQLACEVLFAVCRLKNVRRVNDNLLKLLDFLGNYSMTAGELTGVLEQVSRYMEEPIRGALEHCCFEAEITGDTGLALLSMAQQLEHPKFKELARSMEISVRYCADFSAMVSGSRRSMREYLRGVQERRGILREAMLQMGLLLMMSVAILVIAGRLIGAGLPELLFGSIPGRLASAVILAVLGCFAVQAGRGQT